VGWQEIHRKDAKDAKEEKIFTAKTRRKGRFLPRRREARKEILKKKLRVLCVFAVKFF
jgi:hypothetical protein